MLQVLHTLMMVNQAVTIANVAVMIRHQRLDEIRIIFNRILFKSCFQKSSIMQCTPSTLNAIQVAQHTLVRNACVLAEKTTLLIPVWCG